MLRFAVTLFLTSFAAFGRGGLGAIQGTAVDSQDAAVPGAAVKIVQTTTNIERTVAALPWRARVAAAPSSHVAA